LFYLPKGNDLEKYTPPLVAPRGFLPDDWRKEHFS